MSTGPEHDDRTPQVAEALADLAAHTGVATEPALAARLDALAARGRGPAPEPAGELAYLIAGRHGGAVAPEALPLPGRSLSARRRRAALAAGGLVIALAAGTGAAAADVLPDPVQRAVARFSEHFLPFDLPRPTPAAPAAPMPAGPAATPTPVRPASPTTPAGRSTASPDPAAPGLTHRPAPSARPSSRPASPRSGAPTALPGHRSGAAPTTAPTPGQRGRSQSLPTTPAHRHSRGPVHPDSAASGPARPARPSTSADIGGAGASHRGGVRSLRPNPAATVAGGGAAAVSSTAPAAGEPTAGE